MSIHSSGDRFTMRRFLAQLSLAVLASAGPALGQDDPSRLTIGRIFQTPEFAPQPFGPSRWLGDGSSYTTIEPAADGPGADLVRYDVERGAREVLVASRLLVPPGDSLPLEIEGYSWSPDGKQ